MQTVYAALLLSGSVSLLDNLLHVLFLRARCLGSLRLNTDSSTIDLAFLVEITLITLRLGTLLVLLDGRDEHLARAVHTKSFVIC
mmetsp:Transcript_13579/g.32073  ORF Transcript_13579/g.32073 Transcript_13579/m.32073 type:complete len:85 (-) Transcript_13579:1299-1553(-)